MTKAKATRVLHLPTFHLGSKKMKINDEFLEMEMNDREHSLK